MKIIALEFSADLRIVILLELIKNHSVEVVYFTGGKSLFEKTAADREHFPNTIFHHYLDALAGIPACGIDTSEFLPIGEDLFSKLYECEVQVMSMMTRLNYTNFSHLQKRNLYHKYVWYWNGVLEKYKPNAILFPDVPHTLYNYVVYRLARLKGIKTLMFKRCNGFPGRINFQEDFMSYPELIQEYETIKNEGQDKDIISDEVLKFYEEHNKLRSKETDISYQKHTGLDVPGKERAVEIFPRLSVIKKNILNFTFLKTFLSYIRANFEKVELECLERKSLSGIRRKLLYIEWKKIRDRFRKEYESLQQINYDLATPYIYVPLQYQPEGSSNPVGGVFDDQLLLINLLVYVLPPGWKLYVKENPHQWDFPYAHLGRYSGYYKEIAKHNNVIFLPTSAPTFELVSQSRAVATISGTVGMEGVIRGKPVMIFGHPWYKGCEGVFSVSNVESVRNSLEKIKNGYRPDELKVLQFLEAANRITVKGYVQKRDEEYSGISFADNVKNIAQRAYNLLMAK